MKKMLLIVVGISVAGMLNAQESMWERFKPGYRPSKHQRYTAEDAGTVEITHPNRTDRGKRIPTKQVFERTSYGTGIPYFGSLKVPTIPGYSSMDLPREERLKEYPELVQPVEKFVTQEGKRGYTKGLQDVALIGAGAAAAGYGLYRLYNWYRGDLHALAKHVKTAIAAIEKGITIAQKKGVIGNDQILVSLYSAQQTLNTIDGAVKKEQERRK